MPHPLSGQAAFPKMPKSLKLQMVRPVWFSTPGLMIRSQEILVSVLYQAECQRAWLAFRFHMLSEINGLYSPHSFSLR
jgi:hypothetical protein